MQDLLGTYVPKLRYFLVYSDAMRTLTDKSCNRFESIALVQGGRPSASHSQLVAGKSEPLVYHSDLNTSHKGADLLESGFILNYLLSEGRPSLTDPGSRGQFSLESSPSICDKDSGTCDQWTTEEPINPYAFCECLEYSAHEKGLIDSIVFPFCAQQTGQLSASMKKRRKSVHNERVDIDAEGLPSSSNSIFVANQPVAQNLCCSDLLGAQQEGNHPFTAASSLDELLDLIVGSAEVSSSDISYIQDAFLNFFEKGEFSKELDEYFTKVLESEGIEVNTNKSGCISPQGGRRSRSLVDEDASSLIDAKKSAERRQRNNEASRRSRAAHKARFQALAHELTKLKVEKRELLIWLREIQMAVKEARRALLSLNPVVSDILPDLSPRFSNSTTQ
ncbi:hypothetical protein CRM22_011255 [Opisthorchis felineus]|uniref:BZIP domain-containing protein n=1 Tax=Opisthorchis felineus TaxID=147828 RepID=A0A4S2JTH9_OPIFE|nr:hypothetical protein CRM22_011255 [Opisthorchis felineus]TGZ39792.1 hypothetical protein CRM22_011255 [Opisthorchis felineus]